MKHLSVIIFLITFNTCHAYEDAHSGVNSHEYIKHHLINMKSWRQKIVEVRSCKDIKALSRFLTEEKIWNEGQEVEEAYAELIENLVFENPECLLSALSSQKEHSLQSLVTRYLREPVIYQDYQILDQLSPYRGKYHKVFRILDSK